jgi:dienelactone hydrolase
MIFRAATTSGQTPRTAAYGLRQKVASWGKPRIKQVLVTGFCWGVLPSWLVTWAFRWLRLAEA